MWCQSCCLKITVSGKMGILQRIKPWQSGLISFRRDWMETAINAVGIVSRWQTGSSTLSDSACIQNRMEWGWLTEHEKKILSYKRRKLLLSPAFNQMMMNQKREAIWNKAVIRSSSICKLSEAVWLLHWCPALVMNGCSLCVFAHESLAPLSRNKGFRTACKKPHHSKVSFK